MSFQRGYLDPLFKHIVREKFPGLFEQLKDYSKDVIPELVLENFFKFKSEHIPKKRPRVNEEEID